MEIIVARSAGFCFGVERAVSTVYSEVEKGEAGYGLGYRLTALTAAVLCLLGGIVFLRYNEKKIISRIEEEQKNA